MDRRENDAPARARHRFTPHESHGPPPPRASEHPQPSSTIALKAKRILTATEKMENCGGGGQQTVVSPCEKACEKEYVARSELRAERLRHPRPRQRTVESARIRQKCIKRKECEPLAEFFWFVIRLVHECV